GGRGVPPWRAPMNPAPDDPATKTLYDFVEKALPECPDYFPAGLSWGMLGTRAGSYFAPAETWIIVIRTRVGKNFSGSGRLWACWLSLSFITRSICLIPSVQMMALFSQKDRIETSFSYTPLSV